MDAPLVLRPYREEDEDQAIALWHRSWQAAYPEIDFAKRKTWWRERWRNELAPNATVTVAERDSTLVGFVTVDPLNGYLDQLVVAPELWASGAGGQLVNEAKSIAPCGLALHVNQDNLRAIGFYLKHGFSVVGDEVNPISGKPVHVMRWSPSA